MVVWTGGINIRTLVVKLFAKWPLGRWVKWCRGVLTCVQVFVFIAELARIVRICHVVQKFQKEDTHLHDDSMFLLPYKMKGKW